MVCWHDITNYLSIRQSDALQWTIISWNSSLLLSSLNPLSIKNEKKDHVEQNIYCMICSSNYHVIHLVLFLVNHVCLRLCEISINSIVVKLFMQACNNWTKHKSKFLSIVKLSQKMPVSQQPNECRVFSYDLSYWVIWYL